MRRASLVTLVAFSIACGPPAQPPEDGAGANAACRSAQRAAGEAWLSVASRADEAARPTASEEPLLAEVALERLEAHAAALDATPRAIDGDEAMSLSSAVMDGLDEVSSRIPGPLRDRADDAAEALLTDRGEQGSLRAAQGAIALLEQIVDEVRPGAATRRGERRALAELSRRARVTSEGYARDVPAGDRGADRAEAAPVPEPATDVSAAVRSATDASREARDRCQVARTLAAPSL